MPTRGGEMAGSAAQSPPVQITQLGKAEAVQIGHVESVVVHQQPEPTHAELQAEVIRLLQCSPNRTGIERWMVRDLGTDRLAALSHHQLRRAIRYAEAVEHSHAKMRAQARR